MRVLNSCSSLYVLAINALTNVELTNFLKIIHRLSLHLGLFPALFH